MNDLISVVVPIYNVEKYLHRCIDSIMSQTYKNIEILLIDDGSTDNSSNICDELLKKDQRIKVYHKKNGGLSDARNYGIGVANGKYICFIDSDDFIDSTMIEVLYNDIKKFKVKMSSVYYKEVFDDTVRNDKNNHKSIIYDKISALRELFDNKSICNFAWNKLYDINLFKNVKYPYGKKMEDLGTTYLLVEQCDKISFNPSCLYFYYQREDSILHNKNDKLINDKFEMSINRFRFYHQKYPNIKENYIFEIKLILDSYKHLNDYSKKQCNEIMSIIKKKINILKDLNIKYFIKYILFKISNNGRNDFK